MKATLLYSGKSAAVIAAALAAVLALPAAAATAQAQPETQPAATQPDSDVGPVIPRLEPVVLPPDEPAATGDDDRAARLARRLLANPLDVAARNELVELRARLSRRDADAVAALAAGLRMYLEIGPRLAAGPLGTAAGNSVALSLTGELPRPLDKIAAESRAAASATGQRARPCPKCGDTHLAPCTAYRCNGSGYVSCPKCGGSGVIRGPDSSGTVRVLGVCQTCGGSGVVPCKACGGTGSVPCRACKPKPSRTAATLLPAEEIQEIRKVICKARWIGAGGIDLYTNGARAPSPK